MTKDELKLALHKAFDLGSRYWQQADSEYSSQWKKADATKAQLDQLIEDTAKQALAAPVQEPVNQRAHEMALRQWESWKQYALELQEKLVKYEGGAPMVLNTTPPTAQRQWVELTDEEIKLQWSVFWEAECHPWAIDFARAIEAKLKEKNNG